MTYFDLVILTEFVMSIQLILELQIRNTNLDPH